MDHTCNQVENIATIKTDIALLKQNKIDYMEKLDKLENKVDDGFEKVFDKIDGFKAEFVNLLKVEYLSKVEYEPYKKKVENVEKNIGWLVKLILGVIVLAILGLIITK